MKQDPKEQTPILVSACLLGVNCRYDGESRPHDLLRRFAMAGRVLALCPEQLGGLSTPRRPAEIEGGAGREVLSNDAKILDDEGRDVTAEFIKGARQSLELAKLTGCYRAVLKERSPSCGVTRIVSGESVLHGQGVTAALLSAEGFEIISDEYPGLQEWLDEN